LQKRHAFKKSAFSEILHFFFQEQLINYRDQKFGRSSKFLVVTDMDIPGHVEFGRRGDSKVDTNAC
jgi:hypothetical protein